MNNILIIVFCVFSLIGRLHAHWSYDNIGSWHQKSHYCGGKSQSPIDLKFNSSTYNRRLRLLNIEKQPTTDSGTLINNGHTAQINIHHHYLLKRLTPDSEDYISQQIHFHWGDSNHINGSEHLLEGKSYPLEMHIVSYSSLHPNIVSAMTTTRGLAVIGVFFKLTNTSNLLLEPLIKSLSNVPNSGNQTPMKNSFDVLKLIGDVRLRRYYRYDGSLTTPPCYESVIWTVLHDPIELSIEQLNAFRSLQTEHKAVLMNIFRPIQELGSRKLFRSFYSEKVEDPPRGRLAMLRNDASFLSLNWKRIFLLFLFLRLI